MSPDKLDRTYLFEKKFRITFSSKGDWMTKKVQLPGDSDFWYEVVSNKVDLARPGVHRWRRGRELNSILCRCVMILQVGLKGTLGLG